jgi:hypothetical protein
MKSPSVDNQNFPADRDRGSSDGLFAGRGDLSVTDG